MKKQILLTRLLTLLRQSVGEVCSTWKRFMFHWYLTTCFECTDNSTWGIFGVYDYLDIITTVFWPRLGPHFFLCRWKPCWYNHLIKTTRGQFNKTFIHVIYKFSDSRTMAALANYTCKSFIKLTLGFHSSHMLILWSSTVHLLYLYKWSHSAGQSSGYCATDK